MMAAEVTADSGNLVLAGCALAGLYSLRAFQRERKWEQSTICHKIISRRI